MEYVFSSGVSALDPGIWTDAIHSFHDDTHVRPCDYRQQGCSASVGARRYVYGDVVLANFRLDVLRNWPWNGKGEGRLRWQRCQQVHELVRWYASRGHPLHLDDASVRWHDHGDRGPFHNDSSD